MQECRKPRQLRNEVLSSNCTTTPSLTLTQPRSTTTGKPTTLNLLMVQSDRLPGHLSRLGPDSRPARPGASLQSKGAEMKTRSSALLLSIAASILAATAPVAVTTAGQSLPGGDHALWKIGAKDGAGTEFALAPGGYASYRGDGFFI